MVVETWPALPLEAWADTHATLHMWLQIVGKVRLVQGAPINHSWGVTFYPTATGLTTSPMPYDHRTFAIDFDFCTHELVVRTSDGRAARMALEPQTVASFYRRVMDTLGELAIRVRIHKKPNEVPEAIPFDQDETHRAYDRDYANRYFRILSQSEAVLSRFRARFIGKCSPVHFFWGAPDLAVTRFGRRRAPEHPGGIPNLPERVAREAYSHEVSSVGFWAGGGPVPHAAFYAYAYPEPPGFAAAPVAPAGAFYQQDLREFILPYDVVREAKDPEAAVLAFAQSTYEAAADLGKWDRAALERA